MQWKHVVKDINELKPQEKNPRKISKDQRAQLKKSLKEFGCAQPVVITKENIIVGGHQRFYLLREQRAPTVECMQCDGDLTEQQVDELTIRLNKNTGSFDFDLLSNAYAADDLISWGFSMEELHLEAIPEQQEPPKTFQLTAKFENEDDLRQAETHIATILDLYASASYKVKVK